MRLTITVCPHRGTVLRITVDQAGDYPPDHVAYQVAAAAERAAEDLTRRRENIDRIPAPRRAPDHQPATTAEDKPGDGCSAPREITRRRVLRLLDHGATVAEAAQRFGVDPALIDRWDDDAALDGHIDLLADGPGCHPGIGCPR